MCLLWFILPIKLYFADSVNVLPASFFHTFEKQWNFLSFKNCLRLAHVPVLVCQQTTLASCITLNFDKCYFTVAAAFLLVVNFVCFFIAIRKRWKRNYSTAHIIDWPDQVNPLHTCQVTQIVREAVGFRLFLPFVWLSWKSSGNRYFCVCSSRIDKNAGRSASGFLRTAADTNLWTSPAKFYCVHWARIRMHVPNTFPNHSGWYEL